MMGIRWHSSADQAGLAGNKLQVCLIAMAPWLGYCQPAFLDFGGSTTPVKMRRRRCGIISDDRRRRDFRRLGCFGPSFGFFEPPRLRAGLMVNVDTDSSSDDISTTGPDVDTFPAASGNTACSAILAANDSSTSFASSADSRFFVFRIAIARGCMSSTGRVSISRISCALISADLSAPSCSRTNGILGFSVRN